MPGKRSRIAVETLKSLDAMASGFVLVSLLS